ncbi:hypothetical protein [Trabulsiella odontotermitis]
MSNAEFWFKRSNKDPARSLRFKREAV